MVFHLSGLAGPNSQLLNGSSHEFAELVLARIALLMDQSLSVHPLRRLSQNAGIWRVVAGKIYARTLGLSI